MRSVQEPPTLTLPRKGGGESATDWIEEPAPAAEPRASVPVSSFRRHMFQHGILYVLLGLGSIVMLFPFLWMVATSLKVDQQLFTTPPQLIPSPFAPQNYQTVLNAFPVGQFLINSVIVAAFSTTLQVLTSAMAAYAFARLRFRGRDLLFLVYLATLMIPFQATIVPLFVEMRFLGFVNSYPGLILPTIASAFGTFLLRQAFLGLPTSWKKRPSWTEPATGRFFGGLCCRFRNPR